MVQKEVKKKQLCTLPNAESVDAIQAAISLPLLEQFSITDFSQIAAADRL
jgi:hypothetical protein